MDPKHQINLQGRTYNTFEGLLDDAHKKGLRGIKTTLVQVPTEENGRVAIVHASVDLADGRTFQGLGDAAPGNVSKQVALHLLRMAETRAIARALRCATNNGGTVYEELEGAELASEQGAPTRRVAVQSPEQGVTSETLTALGKGVAYLGWSDDYLREYLVREYGRTSRTELTEAQGQAMLSSLRAMAKPLGGAA